MRSTIGAAGREPLESSEDMEGASRDPFRVSRPGRQAVKPLSRCLTELAEATQDAGEEHPVYKHFAVSGTGIPRPSTERWRADLPRDLARLSWHTQCCTKRHVVAVARCPLRAPHDVEVAGLTAVLVITLALGIGASTTIFSVVNSVVLRPLPYEQPARLARIYTEFNGKLSLKRFWISAPEFQDLSNACRSCASVGGWARGSASLAGGDRPVRVDAAYVTHQLLPLLGVRPLLGRWFDAKEDRPGD